MPTNEDNGGGVLPGNAEQVADSSGRHTLEHLHKLGAVGGEECNVGGPCHGLGQVRFPCAWGALKQNSLHPKVTFHALLLALSHRP